MRSEFTRPADEHGCLYYSPRMKRFVVPGPDSSLDEQGLVLHFGAPGGVVPRISDERMDDVMPEIANTDDGE